MEIRLLSFEDIEKWVNLSSEYDHYVKELVPDLTEWYKGNKEEPSFDFYMESKIKQKEAFMAIDDFDNCLGIVAISKKNNRITFFAISHSSDIDIVGNLLLKHVIKLLDKNKEITINLITSICDWIKKCKDIILENSFIQKEDSLENGVSVNTFGMKSDYVK
jgi:hypothetical protein